MSRTAGAEEANGRCCDCEAISAGAMIDGGCLSTVLRQLKGKWIFGLLDQVLVHVKSSAFFFLWIIWI
jgi:hypothetical protein